MPRIIIETPAELLLKVLQTGTVSTNVFLRRLHNFCVNMNWLHWPLMQRMEFSQLVKSPSSQRNLITEGQPVILEIVITKVESQQKRAENTSGCSEK